MTERTTIQISKATAERLKKHAAANRRSVSAQADIFLAESVSRADTCKRKTVKAA